MESKYDEKEWDAATSVGRRLFLYNYWMRGTEFPGWDLIKSVVMETEPDHKTKVFLWKNKNSRQEELVQISVYESSYWRHAQYHLKDQLEHCMRPNIPHGKGALARVGDVLYAGEDPHSKRIAAIFFSRGNLQITVASAGKQTADVVKFVKKLDDRFVAPPTKDDRAAKIVRALKPARIKTRKTQRVVLVENLPEPVFRSGWLRVTVPDGELRRDGDILYYTCDTAGKKKVGILNFKLE
jgi:hypothetical protein